MLFAKASESELAAIRQACEADLLTFTAVMFQARMCQPFLVNWHHAKMADELMAVYRGETKNLLITMPPGGTKTELAVIHFMAWCFARSQSCRFLHLSGSKELALLNSETVREIVTLEEFQALWPRQIKNDSRAKNRWNLAMMNRTTGGLYATSSGGQVTGFRAGYIRPGFSGAIICFPHDEKIFTENGPLQIGEIVKNSIKINVPSFNFDTGTIEAQPITGWHKNPGSMIIKISFDDGATLRCTPDHKIWTENRGYVTAACLKPSDRLPVTSPSTLNDVFAHSKLFSQVFTFKRRKPYFVNLILSKLAIFRAIGIFFSRINSYISPSISDTNLSDNSNYDSILACKIARTFVAGSNSDGISLCQLCARPFFMDGKRAMPFSIGNILCPCSIRKIFKQVIRWIAVKMPNLTSLGTRTSKGCKHSTVDSNTLSFSVPRAREKSQMPALFDTRLKNSALSCKRGSINTNNASRFAPDSTNIGHVIEPLITRYRSPLLICHDGFSEDTFCISVRCNHNFYVGESKPILVANCDDPLKADDIWSKAKRQAVNRKLTGTIRSRRASSEHTPIIMVMQRLHEDDPAAHALSGDFAAEFKHLEIQAIIDEGTENERSYWQEKESLESLNDLKQKDPYTLSAQYQQRPTPAGGAMIKTSWLQQYSTPPDVHTVLFVFDTAMKTAEINDFSVMSFWGLAGINVYLLDLLRGKWEVPDLEQEAIGFLESHRPKGPKRPRIRGAVIEDKASGTGLIQGLRRKSALRDIPIIAKQRSTDKVSRVNNVLSFIRAGQLWVPESAEKAPWLSAYLGEIAAFSPGMTHQHDDQVDVTVDALEELLQSCGGMSQGMDLS